MRTAMLVGKTTSGRFIDVTTGNVLGCVGQNADIDKMVKAYRDICAEKGVVRIKKDEIKLSEVMLLANNTAGGELKRPFKFSL